MQKAFWGLRKKRNRWSTATSLDVTTTSHSGSGHGAIGALAGTVRGAILILSCEIVDTNVCNSREKLSRLYEICELDNIVHIILTKETSV